MHRRLVATRRYCWLPAMLTAQEAKTPGLSVAKSSDESSNFCWSFGEFCAVSETERVVQLLPSASSWWSGVKALPDHQHEKMRSKVWRSFDSDQHTVFQRHCITAVLTENIEIKQSKLFTTKDTWFCVSLHEMLKFHSQQAVYRQNIWLNRTKLKLLKSYFFSSKHF